MAGHPTWSGSTSESKSDPLRNRRHLQRSAARATTTRQSCTQSPGQPKQLPVNCYSHLPASTLKPCSSNINRRRFPLRGTDVLATAHRLLVVLDLIVAAHEIYAFFHRQSRSTCVGGSHTPVNGGSPLCAAVQLYKGHA